MKRGAVFGRLMVIANAWFAVGATPFVAVITPLKLPAAVGVPRMIPVVPFSARPEGSAPLLTAKVGTGEPVAVRA